MTGSRALSARSGIRLEPGFVRYGVHEVAERLGHDPATLMRYYTRVNAVRRRQAADHAAALVTGQLPVTNATGPAAPTIPLQGQRPRRHSGSPVG
ncbi:hypothetical protein Cs7R123_06310 [Catellatospora sp. TT07R-123]|nr:hypothetical protein Cs7R123_06310 [Catellatospora sp. TT07R-123]